MKTKRLSKGLVLASLLLLASPTRADDNSWINWESGFWEQAINWSEFLPPSTDFDTIWIANDTTKTVTLDDAAAGIPLVMTISNLVIQGGELAGVNTLTLAAAGSVVGALNVTDADEVMLSTAQGQTVRTGCKDIRICGRNTQGVKLINLNEGDKLVAIARVISEQQEEATEGPEAGEKK